MSKNRVRRLATTPVDGSPAAMLEALEQAAEDVRAGKVRSLAVVIVTNDGLVGCRTEWTRDRDPCDWLVLQGALRVANLDVTEYDGWPKGGPEEGGEG